jgi:23S rRNA (cytidine1920-2'-O)/16S rRNA (cytidine1409-2'-O)-methyltransferase
MKAGKPATAVTTDSDLVVAQRPDDPGYASRGGHKLAGALGDFMPAGLVVAGRRCLDAGASTGGFTDVLLRHDAARVLAVDVGYGQLVWSLQTDPRVEVHDRTNIRTLKAGDLGDPVDLVVGDLSFISLTLLVEPLIALTREDGDLVLMVKPQFEVGKDRLGKGGVVRDPALWRESIETVAAKAASLGWGAVGLSRSQLPGPSGNVEFFVWCRQGASTLGETDYAQVLGEQGEKVEP